MSQNKRVVLLGYIGVGKTSLFNLITKSDEKTAEGGKSVTSRVLIGSSQYLRGFEILDTPGFTAEETMESLAGVLAGLYYGDINRILMVVKYERVKQMIFWIKQMFGKIKKLKDIITIVVTHWDKWDVQKNPDDEGLIKINVEKETGINSLIFCANQESTRGNDYNCKAICSQIEKILIENQTVLSYTATDSVLENIIIPDYIKQDELDLIGSQMTVEFRKLANYYEQFINEFNFSDPDSLDIMHYLQLDIKQRADAKIQEFISKYGEKMNEKFDLHSENKQYLLFIKLKKSITIDYQKIVTIIFEKMKQCNIQYYSWIKRCPNCLRVWIKVAGCGKETYCGNRVNEFDLDQQIEESQNNFRKYNFKIVGGKLLCEKTSQIKSQWQTKVVISKYVINNKLVNTNQQDKAFQLVCDELEKFKTKVESLVDKLILEKLKLKLNEDDDDDELFCFYHYRNRSGTRELLYIFELNREFFQIKDDYFYHDLIYNLEDPTKTQRNDILGQIDFFNLPLSQWMENMNLKNQSVYLSFIRNILENQLQNHNKQTYSEGCKFKFIWDDQPPLSEIELKALFSNDLVDYFTNKVQLESDEQNAEKKELLETLNLSITEKLKTVQIKQ